MTSHSNFIAADNDRAAVVGTVATVGDSVGNSAVATVTVTNPNDDIIAADGKKVSSSFPRKRESRTNKPANLTELTVTAPPPALFIIAAPMTDTVVYRFYKFTALADLARLRARLSAVMAKHGVRGTVLLADEGVNGTVAGGRDGADAVVDWLKAQPGLGDIEAKASPADAAPFKRARVKIKNEIVSMGINGVDATRAGERVDAADWNALVDDADTVLVDVRNDYETGIGAFPGAVEPATTNFREFPAFADARLAEHKHKKIAMYCTGGIRCEKATAYLKQRGFKKVFHLAGGILNYLAKVPVAQSKWRGECFVFDERVAVDHELKKGAYDQCYACRAPVSDADKRSEKFIAGAACPRCYDRVSDADRARFLERQKQVDLADQRGGVHIGPDAMNR